MKLQESLRRWRLVCRCTWLNNNKRPRSCFKNRGTWSCRDGRTAACRRGCTAGWTEYRNYQRKQNRRTCFRRCMDGTVKLLFRYSRCGHRQIVSMQFLKSARIAIKIHDACHLFERWLSRQWVWTMVNSKIRKSSRYRPGFRTNPEGFLPYSRDEVTLARPWAIPGTPGLNIVLGIGKKESWWKYRLLPKEPWSHDPLARK